MSDMTIERAVEILNQHKHLQRDNWQRWAEMGDEAIVGGINLEHDIWTADAIIIAKWYESQQLKPLVPEESYYRDYDPEPDESQRQAVDLDAIEARANAATEGPWEWERCYEMRHRHWALVNPQRRDGGVGDGHPRIVSVPLVLLSHSSTWFDEPFDQDPNLQFVAHARTDIPALIALVRSLTADRTTQHQPIDDAIEATPEQIAAEFNRRKWKNSHWAAGAFSLYSDSLKVGMDWETAAALALGWRAQEQLAALTADRDAQGWQPIESAPTGYNGFNEGTAVLLWWPYWRAIPVYGWYAAGRWHSDQATSDEGPGPTHWRPLPQPPADLVKEKER